MERVRLQVRAECDGCPVLYKERDPYGSRGWQRTSILFGRTVESSGLRTRGKENCCEGGQSRGVFADRGKPKGHGEVVADDSRPMVGVGDIFRTPAHAAFYTPLTQKLESDRG